MTERVVAGELRRTLELSLPLASSQLAQVLFAVLATRALGKIGPEALAAGGIALTVWATLTVTASGLFSAVAILAAEADGAADESRVGALAVGGVRLSVGLGVVVAVLVWACAPHLGWLGQPPEVARGASIFLRAAAPGIPAAFLFSHLRHLITGLARPAVAAMAYVVTLFGFGLSLVLFVPRGLDSDHALLRSGALIALSQTFLVGLMLPWLSKRTRGAFRDADTPIVRDIVRVGAPTGVAFATESGFFAATAFFAGHLGEVALGAHQIAVQTCYVAFMVPSGIGMAVSARVARESGRGDVRAARRAGLVGMALSASFMTIVAIVFLVQPEQIISAYVSLGREENAPVISQAKALLAIAAIFEVSDGIQGVAGAALRGRRKTSAAFLLGALGYGAGLGVGIWLGIARGWGVAGLWWGLAAGLTLAALLLAVRFIHETRS